MGIKEGLMMQRVFMAWVLLLFFPVFSEGAPQVRVLKNDDFSIADVKKVLVLPVWYSFKLPGETEFRSWGRFDYCEFVKDAFKKASRHKTFVLKNVKEVWSDILLNAVGNSVPIDYDINQPASMTNENVVDLLQRASEVIDAFIVVNTTIALQNYQVSGFSIPYTTYNYADVIGTNGAVIGQLRSPQYNSIEIPPHEETMLACECLIRFIGTKGKNFNKTLDVSYSNQEVDRGRNLDDAAKAAFLKIAREVMK